MRNGFHTNSFVWAGLRDLDRIADIALSLGYDFLEVGPGVEGSLKEAARRISIGAMIFCRNFIDDDAAVAGSFRKELFSKLETCSELSIPKLICSTGISRSRSIPPEGGCNPLLSLEPALDFLGILTEKARHLGVRILIENCPMYRNIAISPYMWGRIFPEFSPEVLGICYDPSHFVWQMIDVYEPLERWKDRIFHVHLKDTALFRDKLGDVGILHNTAREKGFEENQWWRHTIIGDGEINWGRFFSILGEDSPADLSFELEDCMYEGDPEKVRKAMAIQKARLDGYLMR